MRNIKSGNRFWEMWHLWCRLTFDDGYLTIITPWFAIRVGWWAYEEWSNRRWNGFRLYWGHARGWFYEEGDLMFKNEDTSLSWYPKGTWCYVLAPGFRHAPFPEIVSSK